jgi:hypothetical protein
MIPVKGKARYKIFKNTIRFKSSKIQDRRALVKTVFIAVLIMERNNMFPPIDSRIVDMKPIDP